MKTHTIPTATGHTTRPEPTAADRAAAEQEARWAAELLTEAEATAGTWRGHWIGTPAAA